MNTARSLRLRLTLVILLPILLIAALVGFWAFRDAQTNASDRFDRSLLSAALAISRDTAATGGNALRPETLDLLRDTSGGRVFYHVYAPDGVFVTGYATPPVLQDASDLDVSQVYYDATYQREPVRALRFVQPMTVDQVSGPFTFTVWQNTSVRDGFVRSRTGPTFVVITLLIGALGIVVWFGVKLGLTPLLDLEDAIARRSAMDLSPIKRRIPPEVQGIVGRFNDLVSELSRTLDAKDAFISDAAHQLRNPIAGVQALAESVQSARTLGTAQARASDLLVAAKETGALANNLLTLERARATPAPERLTEFAPDRRLRSVSASFAKDAGARGIRFDEDLQAPGGIIVGDPVMLDQAVLNLLNNALAHGGPTLTHISLHSAIRGGAYAVEVSDDGVGIATQDHGRALGRFSQVRTSAGSGLGLPIAAAVAESSGGAIELETRDKGVTVRLKLPLRAGPDR